MYVSLPGYSESISTSPCSVQNCACQSRTIAANRGHLIEDGAVGSVERTSVGKSTYRTPRPSAYPVRSTSFSSPMYNQVEEAQGAKSAKKSTIVVRLPYAAFIVLCTHPANQYQRRKDIDEDDFDF